ncbi:MAG: hypothetical protein P9C48_02325 [Defluviicoccus sp.]|nr:hypothetical protein [Defluviicoccus sp.]MDG4607948.1 hypothetical protein [Defluviicoccus sp.]
MPRLRVQKTSFAAGEISPALLGRRDLRAYENGASVLRNVFVHPAGGVTRRPGLRFVDTAAGPGRLIAFEFNTEQTYLLLLTDRLLRIYSDEIRIAELVTPWTAAQLRQLNWTQSADTLLIVHPDVPPKQLTRIGAAQWVLSDWNFFSENGRTYAPHFKFAGDWVTVQPSATTGTITVTASDSVFASQHVGLRMRIGNKETQIVQFVSPTTVRADVKETLTSTGATADWSEQAYSNLRGWPVAVCFHQDRLVIGGSRDLPNRLWLSKSGDLFNFDLGEGLDDESIEFPLLSDQVNAIRAVFSGRHLQVFTSGAEWMVTGEPLIPANIQLRRQTRIGSPVDRTVPPRDVDGATLFVPRNGPQLREFLFTDTEQAYQSTDLALLARHLIRQPVDMDYDRAERLLHVVMADGTMATLTVYREEEVSAWSQQETAGTFLAVATVGERTYVVVERSAGFFVEVFDAAVNVDAALTGTSSPAKLTWSGLDHLEGSVVKILADGAVRPEATVADGSITLEEEAASVQAGLGYRHIIEPLPVNTTAGGPGGKVRPISVTFRLHETAALRLVTNRGPMLVPFRRLGQSGLDEPPPVFSGDKTVRMLGWINDGIQPLWRIEDDAPLAFTLLSVATEISVNA